MPLSIRAIWHLFAWTYRQVKRLDARIDALELTIQALADVSATINKRQDKRMAAIDDRIAKLQQDVINIKTLVDGLRQDIENGAPQGALDKLDAIDQALDAIAPDPVEPPTV